MLYDFLKSQIHDISKLSYNKPLPYHKYGILCDNPQNAIKWFFTCWEQGKTAVMLSSKYGTADCLIDTLKLPYLLTDNGIETTGEEQFETEDLTDISLIMPTSGSTGKPKGVMLTGTGLATNISDILEYFPLNNSDKILIVRPLSHAAVLTGELLAGLCVGADIAFHDSFSPIDIAQKIIEEQITVFCGTPTMFHHICRIVVRKKQTLPLRLAAVSGEMLSAETAKLMRQAMPNTQIFHVYGLTEASPRVSYLPPELFDKYHTSVGLPLKSVNVKVEDGELLASGSNVMKSYYAGSPQGEWLHTGDNAEIINGLIYLKGRADDMIIRGGVNIYPQEIESKLPFDCVAYGISDGITQKIGLKAQTELSQTEVFAVCKKELSPHLLPDIIEIVKELKRTESGKLKR